MDPSEALDPEVLATLESLHVKDDEDNALPDISTALCAAQNLKDWQHSKNLKVDALLQALRVNEDMPDEAVAETIAQVAPLQGSDDFILPGTRTLAQDCLEIIVTRWSQNTSAHHRLETITLVLNNHVKPLFKTNQHPKINVVTGRKLHVHEGSRPAYLDLYDNQVWKTDGRGCWNTLQWCIGQLKKEDFETLWPSLIPPLMTMLDDHDPSFRIKAIRVLLELLHRVDSSLLKRTGIDALFAASLNTSLTHFTDPQGAIILPLSSSALHLLIDKTTSPQSQMRFDRLCGLVSKGIVGGAWVYGGDNEDVMEASVEALDPLVDALGIGTCRFLKALIPQLSENLVPKPFRKPSTRLQIISANCLIKVITQCEPRITPWGGKVLDSLLRSWVTSKDGQKTDTETLELQGALRSLCIHLTEACPSVTSETFPALLQLDYAMFRDLLANKV